MPAAATSSSGSYGNAALAVSGVGSAFDILGGLFGYFAGDAMAEAQESRGRMLRMEAEAEAQRFAEQAQSFKASQKLAYLKSGVQLSGSPLDILDETARIASNNIAAIKARGQAEQVGADAEAMQARAGGRTALIRGIGAGAKQFAGTLYATSLADDTSRQNRKDLGLPSSPVPWGQYYNG